MTDFSIIEDAIFTGVNSTTNGNDPLTLCGWALANAYIGFTNIADTFTVSLHAFDGSYSTQFSSPVNIALQVTDGTNYSGIVEFPMNLSSFTGISELQGDFSGLKVYTKTPTLFKKNNPANTYLKTLDMSYTRDYVETQWFDLTNRPTLEWFTSYSSLLTATQTAKVKSIFIENNDRDIGKNVYLVRGVNALLQINSDNLKNIWRVYEYDNTSNYDKYDIIFADNGCRVLAIALVDSPEVFVPVTSNCIDYTSPYQKRDYLFNFEEVEDWYLPNIYTNTTFLPKVNIQTVLIDSTTIVLKES